MKSVAAGWAAAASGVAAQVAVVQPMHVILTVGTQCLRWEADKARGAPRRQVEVCEPATGGFRKLIEIVQVPSCLDCTLKASPYCFPSTVPLPSRVFDDGKFQNFISVQNR